MTFINRKLGNRKHDPKKFWREMGRNLRLGKHTPKKGLFKIANEKGEMLEGKIAADYMNQYLVENEFFEALNARKFSFNFITESVIKNILKMMPLNKSSCI